MNNTLIPHSRPWISEKDRENVDIVLASGMVAQGERVKEFERAVSSYTGGVYGIAQASGTAALILALRTLGIGKGDEVIIPTYVCRSVLEAVLSVSAQPILCDVNEQGVITNESVRHHLSDFTKAIVAVHIFGHPCDIPRLKGLGVPIIDDACQAFGLVVNGRMAGTLGDVGILSFHATKCFTTGEGGMLLTHDSVLMKRAHMISRGGDQPATRSVAPMSDIQAALGISQLSRYKEFEDRRNYILRKYLAAVSVNNVQIRSSGNSNMLYRFTCYASKPFEAVRLQFLRSGVLVRRGVDELLHRAMHLEDHKFPIATNLYKRTVSVPFYPSLTEEELGVVCASLEILRDER